MAAYQAQGGGGEGCAAALAVLDAVEQLAEGAADIDELYREAYATASQLLSLRYGGDDPPSPERVELLKRVASARTAYRALVSPDSRGYAPIPEPATDREKDELEARLWDEINQLPDGDSDSAPPSAYSPEDWVDRGPSPAGGRWLELRPGARPLPGWNCTA